MSEDLHPRLAEQFAKHPAYYSAVADEYVKAQATCYAGEDCMDTAFGRVPCPVEFADTWPRRMETMLVRQLAKMPRI